MKKNRPEIVTLRRAVEHSIGRVMHTPTDFEFCVGVIWERMHTTISPTTLKRLWGYIDGADDTRVSTLSLLSQFLGYRDWDDYLANLKEDAESDMLMNCNSVTTDELQVKDRILIGWSPNRVCLLEYLGDNRFRVLESENAKIKVGDTFSSRLFIENEPLYIDNLRQSGLFYPAFVLGAKSGLTMLQKQSAE